VGYSGRCFFSVVGYNGRGFFPLWDTMEKNYTTQNDIFLDFKFLSLPSNRNLGKISFLNSQTNPWEKWKIIWLTMKTNLFFVVEYTSAEIV
jgi:hypothetical protein